MRILVVGAGAVGGYFGGRLLEAGRDVTFLVRPRRAAELAESGLRIRSRLGDVTLSAPPTIPAENLTKHFDLVLLSCKAYDLENAMESFAPAVGPEAAILPLLNGMRHLDILVTRFGAARVLGGQCVIAATLNQQHEIVHLNDAHALSFGELNGNISDRVKAIENLMAGARFNAKASANVLQDMWEKWVFLSTLAGATCMMRATLGDISAAGGADLVLRLFDECRSVAAAEDCPPRDAFVDRTRQMLTAAGSTLTASMLRDIENNAPIEADHIIGDLLRRSSPHSDLPLLSIVYTHLKSYEARRVRNITGTHAVL